LIKDTIASENLIKKNYINLKYIVSENNLLDEFTKYLNITKINKFGEIILSKLLMILNFRENVRNKVYFLK